MRQIKHKIQFSANGCVPACVSMLAEISPESAETIWLDNYINHHITPAQMFMSVGIPAMDNVKLGGIDTGVISLVYVPALNELGAFHAVLIDSRDIYNIKVYDPAKGFKLRTEYPEGEPRECLEPVDIMAKYYRWVDENEDPASFDPEPENSVPLTSFIQACTIGFAQVK